MLHLMLTDITSQRSFTLRHCRNTICPSACCYPISVWSNVLICLLSCHSSNGCRKSSDSAMTFAAADITKPFIWNWFLAQNWLCRESQMVLCSWNAIHCFLARSCSSQCVISYRMPITSARSKIRSVYPVTIWLSKSTDQIHPGPARPPLIFMFSCITLVCMCVKHFWLAFPCICHLNLV